MSQRALTLSIARSVKAGERRPHDAL